MIKGPVWALLIYVFVYFNIPTHQWWGGYVPNLRWSYIAAGVLILSCIINRDKLRPQAFFSNKPFAFLFLLLALMICIVPISYNLPRAWERVYDFFRYVLVFFLITRIIKDIRTYKLFMYLLVYHCFWLSRLAHHYFKGARLDGVGLPDGSDANMLAALLLLIVPLLVVLLMNGKKWEKICCLIASPFILNAFAMTRSRGGFLGLIASILVLLYQTKDKKHRNKILYGAVLFSLLFFHLMDQEFKNRMLNLTKESPTEQSAGRSEIWQYGIRIIDDYPFGTGGGGFQKLSTRYLPAHLIEGNVGERASHNTYLCILIEQGYLGLILYLCFIASLFIYLSKARVNISNIDNESAIFVSAQTIAIQSGLAGFFTAVFFVDRIYFESIYLVSSMAPVLYNISMDLKHEFFNQHTCSKLQRGI